MQKIIEKWYGILGFENEYGKASEELLDAMNPGNIPVFEDIVKAKNPILNLAWFLYKCEETAAGYAKKGIPEEILTDTLSDIKRWADTYKSYSGGKTGLEEIHWIIRHINCGLFRLGRLQFAFGEAEKTDEEYGIIKGENIMEIHIPSGGRLEKEECIKSFKKAEEFFSKFYPEYNYKFYTCHSWLLDDNLRKIMGADSNIIKFREMFSVISEDESNAALKYIFRWNIKDEEIEGYECAGTLQRKMKEYFVSGGSLCESYGIINRGRII